MYAIKCNLHLLPRCDSRDSSYGDNIVLVSFPNVGLSTRQQVGRNIARFFYLFLFFLQNRCTCLRIWSQRLIKTDTFSTYSCTQFSLCLCDMFNPRNTIDLKFEDADSAMRLCLWQADIIEVLPDPFKKFSLSSEINKTRREKEQENCFF